MAAPICRSIRCSVLAFCGSAPTGAPQALLPQFPRHPANSGGARLALRSCLSIIPERSLRRFWGCPSRGGLSVHSGVIAFVFAFLLCGGCPTSRLFIGSSHWARTSALCEIRRISCLRPMLKVPAGSGRGRTFGSPVATTGQLRGSEGVADIGGVARRDGFAAMAAAIPKQAGSNRFDTCCSNPVPIVLTWARSGPTWTPIFGVKLARVRPQPQTMPGINQICTQFDQHWRILPQEGPNSGPNSADNGPNSSTFLRGSANIGQHWPRSARNGANSTESGPTSTNCEILPRTMLLQGRLWTSVG